MCSYNKVNGLSASENPWLLTTVLREEFGFDGLVVSDWGAVYHRVPALLAGLDLEMPPALPRSPDQVVAAVRAGELDEEVLDARVAHRPGAGRQGHGRARPRRGLRRRAPPRAWPGPPPRSRWCC